MTRDDIIRMAREAKLACVLTHGGGEPRMYVEGADWHDEIDRFAALVAAHEREACAKLCEQKSAIRGGEIFAARIRARGQQI